jgi:hypothetical protein
MSPVVDFIVKVTPAVATVVVGMIAGWVTYHQYKVSRDKLRLDLFSKRLEAYEKLQEFYVALFRERRVLDSMLAVLAEARYKSRFLFGPEIESVFSELWEKAVEMKDLHGRNPYPVGREGVLTAEKDSKREAALFKWMMAEKDDSPRRYARYLHFSELYLEPEDTHFFSRRRKKRVG